MAKKRGVNQRCIEEGRELLRLFQAAESGFEAEEEDGENLDNQEGDYG